MNSLKIMILQQKSEIEQWELMKLQDKPVINKISRFLAKKKKKKSKSN